VHFVLSLLVSVSLEKATLEPVGRDGLINVDAGKHLIVLALPGINQCILVVKDVLNNATVKVLSTRDTDYHCSVVEITAS
jgi:hypothetical protein